MADFKKMTVASLRELARKVLGRGHSRLKTRAELLKALEEAGAAVEAASSRAASRVRTAATRAVESTGKAVRAAGSAVGRATHPRGKPAPAARGGAAKKAAAVRGGAVGAARGAVVGAVAGAKAGARPAPAARKKAGKVATAVGAVAGAAVGAAAGAAAGARAKRKAPARGGAGPAGPDPEGFFVARIRGEEAVREAPHPMLEPATEAEEEGAAPYDERLGELPWGYGDDAFLALPRDPRTLFLYWDLSQGATERAFAGLDQPRAQLWVFARAGAGWDRVRTIDFALESHGYYVHDLEPGRTYRAEIRAVDRQGRDRLVAHGSNEVTLPPVGPSPVIDDRFVRIPWELPLGRLLGPGRAGAPFPDEVRALLARLSDWSRFAGRGGSAGGMGGRPTSAGGPPGSVEGR